MSDITTESVAQIEAARKPTDYLLEGVKLEHMALALHLNETIRARFNYIIAYITANGAHLYLIKERFWGYAIFIFITIFIWRLDLRTRVIIRACTARFVDMEHNVFQYHGGFFSRNNAVHKPDGAHDPTLGTTPGINEVIFLPKVITRAYLATRNLIDGFMRANNTNWNLAEIRANDVKPKTLLSALFVEKLLIGGRLAGYSATIDIFLFLTICIDIFLFIWFVFSRG